MLGFAVPQPGTEAARARRWRPVRADCGAPRSWPGLLAFRVGWVIACAEVCRAERGAGCPVRGDPHFDLDLDFDFDLGFWLLVP